MEDSPYLVIGLGKTGYSIARFLKRRNLPFIVFDTRQSVHNLDDFKQEFPNHSIYLGTMPDKILTEISVVIISPGVDCNLPEIQKIKQLDVEVYGDVECFAKEIGNPVIAITGTNGKSTVTTLVGEMAKSFEISAAVAGNIGSPVLDLVDDGQSYGLWVLELSSFQLDLTKSLQPLAATILNISPDHLDRHGSFANYVNAKQRIYNNAEYCLYNREDAQTIPQNIQDLTAENIISYGLDEPQPGHWGLRSIKGELYIAHGTENLLQVTAVKLKGKHNWVNILAACALAYVAGISYIAIKAALEEFKGLEYRCEFIRNLDEVDWVNDSKGTNVGATSAAINGLGESISGKIILIAGGQAKGADFSELRAPAKQFVKEVIVIGEDSELIASSLHDVTQVAAAESMQSAIEVARNTAKPGDMVLLSPACASFDMFRDFNHRGEVFTKAVEAL